MKYILYFSLILIFASQVSARGGCAIDDEHPVEYNATRIQLVIDNYFGKHRNILDERINLRVPVLASDCSRIPVLINVSVPVKKVILLSDTSNKVHIATFYVHENTITEYFTYIKYLYPEG